MILTYIKRQHTSNKRAEEMKLKKITSGDGEVSFLSIYITHESH